MSASAASFAAKVVLSSNLEQPDSPHAWPASESSIVLDLNALAPLVKRTGSALLVDLVRLSPAATHPNEPRLLSGAIGHLVIRRTECESDDALYFPEHKMLQIGVLTAVATINRLHGPHQWRIQSLGRLEVKERVEPGMELKVAVHFLRWCDEVVEFDAVGFVEETKTGPFVVFHSAGNQVCLIPYGPRAVVPAIAQ